MLKEIYNELETFENDNKNIPFNKVFPHFQKKLKEMGERYNISADKIFHIYMDMKAANKTNK